jgi:hypothetical protein
MPNRIYTRINLFPNVSVQFLRYVSAKQPTAKKTATNHATDLATPPTSPLIFPPPPPPLLSLPPSLMSSLLSLPLSLLSLSLLLSSPLPVVLAVVTVVLNVVVLDVVVVLACCPHRPCRSSLLSLPSSSLLSSLLLLSSLPIVVAILARCHCRPHHFFLCRCWLIVVCEPHHCYSRQCLCHRSRHHRHCYHCHRCCRQYCLPLSPPTLLPPSPPWTVFVGPS